MAESKWIIDATDETFEKEVVERSRETLCVVDFWAEWCAPCRMLGPILEDLAEDYAGKFVLVKVNTEVATKTSMDFGIQSIPAVFAFLAEQPVDGFAGVQSKEQIKEWIDNLLSANAIETAIQAIATDPQTAIQSLEELALSQPENPRIQIGLAEASFETGDLDRATQLIQTLEDRGFLEPEAERIKAKLDLKSKEGIDLETARQLSNDDPDNLDKKLELASALLGHEQYEEGFEICLQLVTADRSGTGDKARELMIEVFRTLPDDSDLTHEYRRKLSMALY